MSLLQAYLQNPKTRRVLSRKPGEKGFSLIELVVVIAVLAVLTAIALPNFLGVSDDAAARSAQQAVVTAFKECQVKKARGEVTTSAGFEQADLNDFTITSTDSATPVGFTLPGATTGNNASPGARQTDCFDSSSLGMLNFAAAPKVAGKFPTFMVLQSGTKNCAIGTETGNENTYNVGCDATTAGSAGDWR